MWIDLKVNNDVTYLCQVIPVPAYKNQGVPISLIKSDLFLGEIKGSSGLWMKEDSSVILITGDDLKEYSMEEGNLLVEKCELVYMIDKIEEKKDVFQG